MIPNSILLTEELEEKSYAGKSYRVIITESKYEDDRISGYVDDLEAIKQTIYFILSTERYEYIIYSWDYGIELKDLFGKPMSYIISELPRRITEALTTDDRIEDVTDFEFEKHKNILGVTFTVVTTVGNTTAKVEVEI